ncbi:MAG TPA: HNH endonuclease family protein [Rubrobacteraceae bacterium]|nr:HNH endonuclease family protein [Rubrobacteraceae bacterium]
MSNKKIIRLAVVLVILAVAGTTTLVSEFGGTNGTAILDPGAAPADAVETLEGLEVFGSGSMAGYSREKFPHWSDAREYGWDVSNTSCDARDAALIRDGEEVVVEDGCDVVTGVWLDPFTAQTFTDPSDIDVDHGVPLANAWRSGADSWDAAERERYANDPDVLLSVEDNANQSKGDKGPEAWKPPNEAEWCDYAKQWTSIKAKYELSVNEQEKQALPQMLGSCESG